MSVSADRSNASSFDKIDRGIALWPVFSDTLKFSGTLTDARQPHVKVRGCRYKFHAIAECRY
jgi:hypothetical protein